MTAGCGRALILLLLAACAGCTPIRNGIKPPYLVDGKTYDEAGLRQYAEASCKGAAADAPLPPRPFTTDGCSLWPDGAWRECCIVHDVAYWCGGPAARVDADRQLRACVGERSGPVNPLLMYFGVRIAGSRLLPLPWRWGYGYPWPYRDPPADGPPVDGPPPDPGRPETPAETHLQ